MRTARAPKAALSARAWEALALLWSADQRGQPLRWRHSKTVEYVLIKKHTPPLTAALADLSGYTLTDRGREFYRVNYPSHIAAHPEVKAGHASAPSRHGLVPVPRAIVILVASSADSCSATVGFG